MTIETPRLKISSIQLLRAIAALIVVIFHAAITVGGTTAAWGQMGVDIFFVISGFIMVHTSLDLPRGMASARSFAWNRLRRIVPMYWLVTLCMVGLLVLIPWAFGSNKLDVGHTLASFLFLPASNPLTGSHHPVVFVGWSLNMEMWFYLLFAIALFLPVPTRILAISVTLLLCVIAGFTFEGGIAFETYTSVMMLEFLAGCLIGWAVSRWRLASQGWGAAAFALGAVGAVVVSGLDVNELTRVVFWGIPGALLVAGVVLWERSGTLVVPRFGVELGNSSYSLYLIHPLVLAGLGKVLPHGLMAMALSVLICVVVGHLLYLAIERPLDHLLRRLGNPEQKQSLPLQS